MSGRLVIAALILGAAAGCTSTPQSGRALIGSGGGTLAAGDVTLTIPAGALAGDQTISVAATDMRAPAGYELFSPIFDFEPAGIRFARPVTVTIAFHGDQARAHLYWSRDAGPGYDTTAATFAAGALTTTVTHFSGGWVGAPLSLDAGGMDASPVDAGPSDAVAFDGGGFDPGSIISCTYAVAINSSVSSCVAASCVIPSATTTTRNNIAVQIQMRGGASDFQISPGDNCGYDAGPSPPPPSRTGRALVVDAQDMFSMIGVPNVLALDCRPPTEHFFISAAGGGRCGAGLVCSWSADITVAGGDTVTINSLHASWQPGDPMGCGTIRGCQIVTLDCAGSAVATVL